MSCRISQKEFEIANGSDQSYRYSP